MVQPCCCSLSQEFSWLPDPLIIVERIHMRPMKHSEEVFTSENGVALSASGQSDHCVNQHFGNFHIIVPFFLSCTLMPFLLRHGLM